MVEITAFEKRHTGNRIGGSNPPASVTTIFDTVSIGIKDWRFYTWREDLKDAGRVKV